MEGIFAALVLLIVGSTIGSVKIVNQGTEVLIERLGKYRTTLKPGVNFIVPFLDTVVWEETTREQVLDIPPQEAITRDNVSLKADAVVYWRILDLKKAYYAIDNVEKAVENLVLTMLRSEIGQMELEKAFAARKELNQSVLQELDEATEPWGVKVTRVEVRDILPARTVLESMEQERAAEIKKRAAILEAEGTAAYMRQLSEVLKSQPNGKEVFQFFLAQKYVDANYRLGESNNSKIVFMDPKAMSEAITDLLSSIPDSPNPNPDPNHNSNGHQK